MRPLPLAALAALLALPLASPAAEGQPPALRLDGRACFEFALGWLIDAARAREFVPQRFAILGEASGRAGLTVSYLWCDAWLLDGRDIGPGGGGNLAVFVESYEDSGPITFYQIRFPTTFPEVAARFRALGLPDGLAEMDHAWSAPAPFAQSFEGRIALGEGAYALRGVVPEGADAPGHTGVALHDGRLGVVRATFVVKAPIRTEVPLVGSMEAEPGTALARLIDGASPGVGGAQRFDFDGTYELT